MIEESMDGKNAHPGGHLDGNMLCDYAEGALDAHAHAAAESHLRECQDCLRELKAVRTYFRGISDLEPVKAPPNFLANVRARLPQPSPWASIAGALMRPWRAVPMSIAGLTILGVAVISLYVQQRGGITETSLTMTPVSPQAPAEPALVPHPASASPSKRDEDAKAAVSNADDAKSREAVSPPAERVVGLAKHAPHERNDAALKRFQPPAERLADAAPKPEASASKTEPAATSDRGEREDKARKDAGYADEAAAMDGIASAKEERPAAPAQKALGNVAADSRATPAAAGAGAPILSQVAPAKKAKSAALASRSPAPLPSYEPSAPPGQSASPYPAFTLKPRNIKDTSAILSGLKAMGAEILPAGEGPGATHTLRVPRSMLPEILPYLSRYGAANRDGAALPEADGRADVSLRFILP
jgi:hypothetical protein